MEPDTTPLIPYKARLELASELRMAVDALTRASDAIARLGGRGSADQRYLVDQVDRAFAHVKHLTQRIVDAIGTVQ